MTDSDPPHHQGLSTPNPDPTRLTTAQLIREVDNASKILQGKIDSNQRAFDLRFETISRELVLIEQRRVELKQDTKEALDDAFASAQKAVEQQADSSQKAIAKSELNVYEQSKQQNATIAVSLRSLNDGIIDLKDRVGKIEAMRVGSSEDRVNQRLDTGVMISLLFVLVSVLGVGVTIAIAVTR